MKSNLRTFVVINPTAGGNALADAWREIIEGIRARLPEVEFSLTESIGHATEITRKALREGWEQIVSIGGDGTNNEVLNGFFEPIDDRKVILDNGYLSYAETLSPPRAINPDAVLALIPFGTGGDFRRTLNISTVLETNLDRLIGRNTKRIDIGEVAYIDHEEQVASRLFLNIGGGGFSGRVVEIANRTWKEFIRGWTFRIVPTIGWLTWSNPWMRVALDGDERPKSRIFNIAVANGEYFGGGMHIAKGASLTDGQFDVITCGNFNRYDSFTLMFRIFSAKHFGMKKVKREKAKQVQLASEERRKPILIDIDGEDLGKFPATFTIHPLLINIKV